MVKEREVREVVLSLGSNLGDKDFNILEMEREIEINIGHITKKSPIYYTTPIGVDNHPNYLNRVVSIDYRRTPEELLRELQTIERVLGREDKGELKPRTADIDILLFQGEERNGDNLTIPHHAFFGRRFSLEGAIEVSPYFVLPNGNILKDAEVDDNVQKQELSIYSN